MPPPYGVTTGAIRVASKMRVYGAERIGFLKCEMKTRVTLLKSMLSACTMPSASGAPICGGFHRAAGTRARCDNLLTKARGSEKGRHAKCSEVQLAKAHAGKHAHCIHQRLLQQMILNVFLWTVQS